MPAWRAGCSPAAQMPIDAAVTWSSAAPDHDALPLGQSGGAGVSFRRSPAEPKFAVVRPKNCRSLLQARLPSRLLIRKLLRLLSRFVARLA
jgi:hypothetical protein